MAHARTLRVPAVPGEIGRAIEVFVRGFCFTRSFTHPYVPERVEGVWALRDAPRRHGSYRSEEWFAHATPPAQVDRVVRTHGRGRFAICAILPVDEQDDDLRAGYKALGYRLRTTEPIMAHSLRRIPRCDAPLKIERVATLALAQRLARAAGSRQILPEHVAAGAAAPIRAYVAMKADEPVGWVGSITVDDATWCSNMFVVPGHRRQGIARAMLSHVLRDDRAAGSTKAILAASHTGAKLYATVGYKSIATLYMWSPTKR